MDRCRLPSKAAARLRLILMDPFHLFVGTYTSHGSKGVYALTFDSVSGQFGPPALAAETPNPTYLARPPDAARLYAVNDSAAMAVGFAIAPDRTHLTPLVPAQPAVAKAPSHLALDASGRTLIVANYHLGFIASLPVAADGQLGPPASRIQHHGSSVNPERQSSPHPHCVTVSPDNRFVFVCDLGLDKIFTYQLDAANAVLTPHEPAFVTSAPGAGPRHLVFSPDGRHAFMISEMGGTVTVYCYEPSRGTLVATDTQSTLPADFRGENKSAAIRVHPNGRFIYGTNRGHDSVAVFAFDSAAGRLSRIEIVSSGGAAPRDAILTPDARWLLVALQDSNTLTALRVDAVTGRLAAASATANVPKPVCLVFA
jgi:6-phosphogluconolactonase